MEHTEPWVHTIWDYNNITNSAIQKVKTSKA